MCLAQACTGPHQISGSCTLRSHHSQNPNMIQIVWNLLGFNLCYSWNPSPAPHLHRPSSKHCRKMVNGEALLHPIPFIATENWQNPSIWKKLQESNQQKHSNSWNAQQEELRKTLEMQSKALGASEYCNIHACMHTYIPEQPYERLCRQHGWEQEYRQDRRRLPPDFFYQMARTHSPVWQRSVLSPPKSQASQAWEKLLLLLP